MSSATALLGFPRFLQQTLKLPLLTFLAALAVACCDGKVSVSSFPSPRRLDRGTL